MGQSKLKGRNKDERVATLLKQHSAIMLTRERYNAFVAWTRSPIAPFVGEELAFYATENESCIGVLIMDITDRDFGYVLLGRDSKGRFRCTDVEMSMKRNEAQHALLKSLKKYYDSGSTEFPQGDEDDDKAGVDIFTPVVSEAKLNPTFQLLRTSDHWIPARSIMTEMMRHFTDVDGNFVEQFQTTGLESRMWELYLYAALLEEGLFVSKPNPAPDFMVHWGDKKVFVEAVTVNPSPNDKPPPAHEGPFVRSPKEVEHLLAHKVPIRFGSPLWSKLTRKNPYWEIAEVVGHPLVFAVADFHEDQSMTWTSTALLRYLYGVRHDHSFDEHGQLVISSIKIDFHEHEGKRIPSGFFWQEKSENVSAVLFSSSGTLAKFNRMGRLAGFSAPRQIMFREGTCHRHDANSALPDRFFFEVEPGKITETWAEGLSMFHNPRAKHPIDRRMFPNIAHHYFEDGQIQSFLPEFHPYGSFTWNWLITDDPKKTAESGEGTEER